jgi:error-prone DNA polymerase
MIAVRGRIQREGEVVHLVARQLTDLSAELATVGSRDAAFPLMRAQALGRTFTGISPADRIGDLVTAPVHDIYIPDLHLDTVEVKSRNFR